MSMIQKQRERIEHGVIQMRLALRDYEDAQRRVDAINVDYEAQGEPANGRAIDWEWRRRTDAKREKAIGDANGARLKALLYAAVVQAETAQQVLW